MHDIKLLLMLARAGALLRIAVMMGVLTVLSGCLVSYKPLFESSVFPFLNGTQFVAKSLTPSEDTREVLKLTIENGGYTAKSKTRNLRFKLYPLTESTWLAMFDFSETAKTPYYQYALLRSHHSRVVIGNIGKAPFVAWAKANNVVTGWAEEKDSIEVRSIEVAVHALSDLIDWSNESKVLAYDVVSPESTGSDELITTNKKFQEEVLAEIESKLTEAKNDVAELEKKIRTSCGGRYCITLEDGRKLYRTETYNPQVWYYEDGQLAPETEWPE